MAKPSYSQAEIERLLGENLNTKAFANLAEENNSSKRRANIFAKAQEAMKNKTRKTVKEQTRSSGQRTLSVLRQGSSFKRATGISPKNYIRSRRVRHGRKAVSSYANESNNESKRPFRQFPSMARKQENKTRKRENKSNAGPKPRPGKFMRECKLNSEPEGCPRHKTTGDCKFIHRDEPEWAMLREDQKKHGGSVPPLSKVNTYTSWPGGIDPTATLYNQATML